MKRFIAIALIVAAGAVFGSAVTRADDKAAEKTIVGYISDKMCGLDHSMMKMDNDKECTLKCAEGGSKLVLADKDHKSVYILDAQDKAREFAGQMVQVTGQVDAKTKSIHVTKIEAAPQ